MKSEQEPVPDETKWLESERAQQPKPSVFASKYPRLKEIDSKLKARNKAIFEGEKKRDKHGQRAKRRGCMLVGFVLYFIRNNSTKRN